MTERRRVPADLDGTEPDDRRADASWQPTVLDDERRWRRHLTEEMRPLLDALGRLRDRGLLD